ncbi:thiamine-phosphate kinase [Alkalicoccus luteus]|uniref:Thiamine-monophosphate kinase n=1 Tax=Alkalicoccus luteus TaxID=1237094 RepID=A0A969PSF8_9BACI|nr:thiamine-phosphate kinase [Alkalicoccus luteus]NJP38685.1 thiamine-phosphate kinase [Alkalicoccus luteus]
MNEFDWIRSIAPTHHHRSSVIQGIGDDAAVFRPRNGWDMVTAVDSFSEGVHFTKDTMPLDAVGYKLLAANVSDLAAMGAVPLYYLVSAAIPATGWKLSELDPVYAGMKRLGDAYSMDLIGGDTISTGNGLVLTITVIGRVEQDRRLLRSSARPGDVLFLTGPVGLAAAGLSRLLAQGKSAWSKERDIEAHQYPVPHVEYGRVFAESGLRVAINDVSDGIAHEAEEIAEASNVAVTIIRERLPETGIQAESSKLEDWMLRGGEDFVLIGAASEADYLGLEKTCAEQELPLYRIGFVEEGNAQVVIERNGKRERLTGGGYSHF